MENFNKSHNIAGQSDKSVQKSQKHDANLQKNSALYFQVGLIICLLGTYALFEMNFEKTLATINYGKLVDDDIKEVPIENFQVYEEISEQKPQEKTIVKLIDKEPIIKDDDFEIKEPVDIITSNQVTTDEPLDIDDIDDVDNTVIENIPIPFYRIEKAPIYPGCESATTNEERKQCMSNKITQLVSRKFSPNLASDLGLTGIQRIYVQFKIDKSGNVVDIQARAPHSGLEKEAIRVVNKLPNMKPGLQRNMPVEVIYSLPISFQVNN